MRATAIAHTNVALIKYWGKRDEQLILPANSSLSFTVDKFYTKTTIEWDDNLKHDRFILDGKEKTDAKVTRFIDKMREEFGLTARALIVSENHVPTAAGLASSASAFAALALAGSRAAGRRIPNNIFPNWPVLALDRLHVRFTAILSFGKKAN